MEFDPFAVVESMTIEGFATGASKGFLYIRGEYPLAESRIRGAIEAARAAGYLGLGVAGSGLRLRHRGPARRRRLHLRRGDGAVRVDRGQARRAAQQAAVPGRGRAVRQADRGQQRRDARQRPARSSTATAGAAARATRRSARRARPARSSSACRGHVVRPGVYEVPFGTTLRELLELGGGVPGGRSIRAILLGGAAGVFVGPDVLDTPLTFEGTRAINATLGSGVVMVFDETADMVGTLRRIAAFFRDESCGQCVPCRVGTVRQEELLARLADRVGGPDPRRGAGAPRRHRPGDARREHLRPRPDGLVGDRVGDAPAGAGGAVTAEHRPVEPDSAPRPPPMPPPGHRVHDARRPGDAHPRGAAGASCRRT